MLVEFGSGVIGAALSSLVSLVTTSTGRKREDRALQQPVVQQVADVFLDVRRVAMWRRTEPSKPQPEFEDVFETWWDEHRLGLDRLVLEVRDDELRERFKGLSQGLWMSGSAYHYAFGDQKTMVEMIGGVGAELAGEWLREQKPARLTLDLLKKIDAAVADDAEQWEEQWQAQHDWMEEKRRTPEVVTALRVDF